MGALAMFSFLKGLGLSALDVGREIDTGREDRLAARNECHLGDEQGKTRSQDRPAVQPAARARSVPEHSHHCRVPEGNPPGDKRRPRLQSVVLGLEARFAERILSVSDRTSLRWGGISGEAKRLTGHSPGFVGGLYRPTTYKLSLLLFPLVWK